MVYAIALQDVPYYALRMILSSMIMIMPAVRNQTQKPADIEWPLSAFAMIKVSIFTNILLMPNVTILNGRASTSNIGLINVLITVKVVAIIMIDMNVTSLRRPIKDKTEIIENIILAFLSIVAMIHLTLIFILNFSSGLSISISMISIGSLLLSASINCSKSREATIRFLFERFDYACDGRKTVCNFT